MHVVQSAAHPLVAAASAAGPLSPSFWLSSFGALGVFAVVFAETGLLVGFFLPGDSLLFTAGLFCSAGVATSVHLSLGWVLVAAVAGALAGAQTGFWLGRRGGRALLARSRNRWLHRGADRAEQLLARYGYAKAIVLARFIPVVRTVLNPLAGMLSVPTRTFTLWQVAGGAVWSAGVTLAGYVLGSSIPGIDQYLLPAIAVIVIVSAIPVAVELLRSRARTEHPDGPGYSDRPRRPDGPGRRGRHRSHGRNRVLHDESAW